MANFLSAALRATRGPRVDPLDELEQDPDVLAAIADVELLRQREAEIRRKTRLQRFQDTVKEWGRYSSYDGIAHMVLADNNWVLVFWSLLVFLSFSLFFYLLFITLQNYLAYGTNIQQNFSYKQFQFPTITVCNNSPYKLSQIDRSPGLQALVKLYKRLLAEGRIKS